MREDRQYIRGQNAARTILRQEVASGCPICRSAFLTYHHFDPPWREKKHWNPDGMIALCREHHDAAEGGHYTIEYLRGLKRGSYSITDVKKGFPWSREQYVVRVGGIYVCGSNTVLSADGEPVIQIARVEDDLLSLSFVLRNESGQVIAKMDDNFLSLGPYPPHDLLTTSTATRIAVWSKRRAIAMDLSLKKMTLEGLDSVVEKDRARAQPEVRPEQQLIEERLKHLPPEILKSIESSFGQESMPKTPDSIAADVADFRERFGKTELPDEFLEAHFSSDPIGYRIKTWAKEHCLDSDSTIALLDFENLSLFTRERQIRIRNGIGGANYNASFDCDTGLAL